MNIFNKALGATENFRLEGPGGKIGHAEIKIRDGAVIMLADEHPEMGALSPQSLGGTPVRIHIYVKDVDALARQAEAAGAKIERPAADQFYGDRSCMIADPFGHLWGFATHIEDLSSEEIRKRAEAKFGGN
jgi:PhnB protein